MKQIVLAFSVFGARVFLLSHKGAASQIERTDEINFSVQNRS
ncbi:hypothetical protein ENLAB_16540 [Enterococcus innesii]|uniref:Uncharacterized protein n=1 Tax=Enterococcus innesii TaxID=2839759 RepID=A0ABN6NQ55_9ENTE|nr:hypothetical protein [Enterococcus innesii]BDG68090.1 hypothetical protein ENLAB_16540 [Enterococcus innesii]